MGVSHASKKTPRLKAWQDGGEGDDGAHDSGVPGLLCAGSCAFSLAAAVVFSPVARSLRR